MKYSKYLKVQYKTSLSYRQLMICTSFPLNEPSIYAGLNQTRVRSTIPKKVALDIINHKAFQTRSIIHHEHAINIMKVRVFHIAISKI